MIEKSIFDICLDFVLEREGGYSNHPADRGGETNLGITANALAVAKSRGLAPESATVKGLTRETVAPIYSALYWEPARCPVMSRDMALVVFDSAVNHGVRTALRLMQRGLNALGGALAEDGAWGPKTSHELMIAEAFYPTGAALATIQKRAEYYDSIVAGNPSQRVFLQGWKNRLFALRSEVLFS